MHVANVLCAVVTTVIAIACSVRPLVGGIDGRCRNGEAPIPDGELDVCVTTPMRDFLTCVKHVGKREEAIRHVRKKKASASAGTTASISAEDNTVDEFSSKYAENNEVQTCRENFFRARSYPVPTPTPSPAGSRPGPPPQQPQANQPIVTPDSRETVSRTFPMTQRIVATLEGYRDCKVIRVIGTFKPGVNHDLARCPPLDVDNNIVSKDFDTHYEDNSGTCSYVFECTKP